MIDAVAQLSSSPPLDEVSYVQDAFRIAVGLSKELHHLLPPVPIYLQRLFTRAEECERMERDQWDNWEHGYSENYKRGKLWTAECDEWMQQQREQLLCQGVPLLPLWPKGYQFAVCLTHDVDYIGETMTMAQRGRELLRSIKAIDLPPQHRMLSSLKGIAKMLLKPSSRTPKTTNTLEISFLVEKELGVTASYFFTVPPKLHVSRYDCLYSMNDRCCFLNKQRQVKDVMSHLVQEGFDVGLHGSYFSAVKEGLLADQKEQLEKAIQAPIYTTRQHWLHLHLPLTLNLQERAHFLADTTLGFNRNIGFRAGTGLPFFAYDRKAQRQLSLIEAPMIIQDGALIGENALEYGPLEAFEVAKEFMIQTRKTKGCITFLFHPDIFLKDGLASLYRSIIEYSLSQNAWVTDLNRLQQWWRERAEKLS